MNRLNNYLNDLEYKIIYKENALNIVNYSEILDFTREKITIKYQDKILNIKGDNLVISKMENQELLIIGNITKLEFLT